MSQFEIEPDEPVIRQRRPRPSKSGEARVAIRLLIIVLLGAILYAGYRWGYVAHVVKPREHEQRKLHDKYNWHLKNLGEMQTDLYRDEDLTGMRNIEAECKRRWNKHPDDFRDLPPTDSPYYRD